MRAPHHQRLPPSIAEALVASSDVRIAKLEGGTVVDMSRHRCSAASRSKLRKRGTGYGTIAGFAPGVAAAAAGSPRECADLHASEFFCRPARRNGGARGGAATRRAAAPTLFALRAGARVADTRICRHAARAARLRCQFFTLGVDAGKGAGSPGVSAAARRDRVEAGARAAGRNRFGGGAPAIRAFAVVFIQYSIPSNTYGFLNRTVRLLHCVEAPRAQACRSRVAG